MPVFIRPFCVHQGASRDEWQLVCSSSAPQGPCPFSHAPQLGAQRARTPVLAQADLVTHSVADLKQMLRAGGLPTTGSKDMLIDRLTQAGSFRASVPNLVTQAMFAGV